MCSARNANLRIVANMCVDYVANEGNMLATKVIFYENFPNRLMNFTIKDISSTWYEPP